MKLKYKIMVLACILSIGLTLTIAALLTGGTLTPRTILFDKAKGGALTTTTTPITLVKGDSVYFSSVEVKGTWSVGKPWPYQALAWLQDKWADNPLAKLDWTGFTIDTTWAIADLGNGVGKYTINKKVTQDYSKGVYSNPALTGFLAKNNVYKVEVYTVKSGVQTLAKNLNFDLANKDTAFGRIVCEVSYVAEGRGTYPINAAKRPDSLVSATAVSRIQLSLGLSGAWFNIPDATDSLKFVFKSKDGDFASYSVPLRIVEASEVGMSPEVKVLTPLPAAGFYAAGDTIEVQIDLLNNGGNKLDWVTSAKALGVQRIEVLASGPKRDYYQIFSNRYILTNYLFTYDSVSKANYSSNIVRIPIPKTLVNGEGTYTIFVGARRIFGAQTDKAVTVDIQVGNKTVDQLNFTSQDATKSCSSCHGVNGPSGHHSSKGVEQCLTCHTKTFRVGFDEVVHEVHQNDPSVNLGLGKCTTCHLNGSETRIAKDAQTACYACHTVIPFMPQDHLTGAPLFSATGMSCSSLNCHAGGGVGMFKNVSENHENLATNYPAKAAVAKKLTNDLAIDSFDDAAWAKATAVTTKDGIELKFFYTATDIIIRAEWTDGHNNFSGGKSAGTNSVTRNQWTFDGTNWTYSGNEDRLSFAWAMNDSYGASCANTCHGVGAGHSTSTGKMDNWHWKAQRTAPIDYCDDGYWDNAGRKSDAVTAGYFGKDNLNSTTKLPILMAKDPANNTKPYVKESETVAFDPTSFKAGDKLFGYAVNDVVSPIISGSRGDVKAKSRFNETTKKWTVIFKRALNTNNTDDAIFDITKTIDFTVAKMDNEGGKHASQGFDIGITKLTFSSEIVKVDQPIEFVTGLDVYPNPAITNANVSFTLNTPTHVDLMVLDVSGKIVTRLVDATLNYGVHKLNMNTSDLSPGVYFLQLNVGEKRYMKNMIVIK